MRRYLKIHHGHASVDDSVVITAKHTDDHIEQRIVEISTSLKTPMAYIALKQSPGVSHIADVGTRQ